MAAAASLASLDGENAQGYPPILLRRFTQFDNELLDLAMAKLSGSAWKCLCYLVRRTTGYHEENARIPLMEFCEGRTTRDGRQIDLGAGLSRKAVTLALAELHRVGMVTCNAAALSQTMVRCYSLQPSSEWHLDTETPTPTTPTRVKTTRVRSKTLTRVKTTRDETPTRVEITRDDTETRVIFTPLRNIERETYSPIKDTQGDAANAAGAPAPLATLEEALEEAVEELVLESQTPKASQPKADVTPERAYRIDLMQRFRAKLGTPFRNQMAVWSATRRYWNWHGKGEAADLDDLMCCYDLTASSPEFDARPLDLLTLAERYTRYLRNPDSYRQAIERKRKALTGAYDRKETARRPSTQRVVDEPDYYSQGGER